MEQDDNILQNDNNIESEQANSNAENIEIQNKKKLTKAQIISLISVLVAIIIIVAILVAKFYIMPEKDNNETTSTTVVNDIPVIATEEQTEETTLEESTDTTTNIATTNKHKPFRADKNVTVHVASGNSSKDEDKGPNRVPDSSLNGNDSSGPSIDDHHDDNKPPEENKPDKPITAESFSSDYTNFYYADTSNLTGWQQIDGLQFYFDSNNEPLKGIQKIGGRNYFFNNYGANASKVGIDVSYYNGNIDWNKVKNDGIDYAIIRVGFRGYGTSTPVKPALIDKNLEKNLKGASAAGMPIGLYFFSQAITIDEAIEEASLCIKYANEYKIDYPIYFDTEFSNPQHDGRADSLSKQERTEIATAFCETVKNSGYTPGIYASKSFYYNQLEYSKLSKYQIWMAHYTPNETDFKHPFRMWQYSDKGSVDGITGNGGKVDINISYYDYVKKTDMKNNGKYIVMTNKNGVIEYKKAEIAISKFEKSKTDEYYDDAVKQINEVENKNVKDALLNELKKMKKV